MSPCFTRMIRIERVGKTESSAIPFKVKKREHIIKTIFFKKGCKVKRKLQREDSRKLSGGIIAIIIFYPNLKKAKFRSVRI